jgi:hypothetical protein
MNKAIILLVLVLTLMFLPTVVNVAENILTTVLPSFVKVHLPIAFDASIQGPGGGDEIEDPVYPA